MVYVVCRHLTACFLYSFRACSCALCDKFPPTILMLLSCFLSRSTAECKELKLQTLIYTASEGFNVKWYLQQCWYLRSKVITRSTVCRSISNVRRMRTKRITCKLCTWKICEPLVSMAHWPSCTGSAFSTPVLAETAKCQRHIDFCLRNIAARWCTWISEGIV